MTARITKTSPFTDLMHTMEFDLYDQDEFDLEIEETIGLLYSKFYQLRQLGNTN